MPVCLEWMTDPKQLNVTSHKWILLCKCIYLFVVDKCIVYCYVGSAKYFWLESTNSEVSLLHQISQRTTPAHFLDVSGLAVSFQEYVHKQQPLTKTLKTHQPLLWDQSMLV
jgi:hypothetical protein